MTTTPLDYMVIQHDPAARLASMGILSPVNASGPFKGYDEAISFARPLATERPELETLLVLVTKKVTP